jgi:hypothetical protein
MRPLAFSWEFVATLFVSVIHASLHIALVCLVNSDALELFSDWWLGWVYWWLSWVNWIDWKSRWFLILREIIHLAVSNAGSSRVELSAG